MVSLDDDDVRLFQPSHFKPERRHNHRRTLGNRHSYVRNSSPKLESRVVRLARPDGVLAWEVPRAARVTGSNMVGVSTDVEDACRREGEPNYRRGMFLRSVFIDSNIRCKGSHNQASTNTRHEVVVLGKSFGENIPASTGTISRVKMSAAEDQGLLKAS